MKAKTFVFIVFVLIGIFLGWRAFGQECGGKQNCVYCAEEYLCIAESECVWISDACQWECGNGMACGYCYTEEDCAIPGGCYWYNGVCHETPLPTCGPGENCVYCSEEECAGQEECFWANNNCYSGTPSCGAGDLCQYCDESGCLALPADCSWVNNFCYIFGEGGDGNGPYNILLLNSGFIASLLEYADRLFTDLKTLIAVAIGLPLGFWVIRKAIGLVRKRTK